MAVAVEGFTVVALLDRIQPLLDAGHLPNQDGETVNDGHLWHRAFMAHDDAKQLLHELAGLGLNTSTGPNPDAFVVCEFTRSMEPHCEWIRLARLRKTIVAWKVGTNPELLVVRRDWDPEIGSGLQHYRPEEEGLLTHLRTEDGLEVYRDERTGKECYTARSPDADDPDRTTYERSLETISRYFVHPAQAPATGEAAREVESAVSDLATLIERYPAWCKTLMIHARGLVVLGRLDDAYRSLRRASNVQQDDDMVAQELGGVCLAMGRFDEAVVAAERTLAHDPSNPDALLNCATAYVLAGRTIDARETIAAARRADPSDNSIRRLASFVDDVFFHRRPRPRTLDELQWAASRRKRPWWKFWSRSRTRREPST